MPRTNQDGKDLKLTVSWLINRALSDADMAEAVGVPTTTYSRKKDEESFPSFEDLQVVANHFGLSALALQIAFGYLDLNMVLLDEDGMRQYVEQGGGETPTFPTRRGDPVNSGPARRRRRQDAPPGP